MQRGPAPQAARVREADRETLRDFGDHLRAKGVSPKTLHIYVDAGESFAAFCADHGMPDLEAATREHIEAWLREVPERLTAAPSAVTLIVVPGRR